MELSAYVALLLALWKPKTGADWFAAHPPPVCVPPSSSRWSTASTQQIVSLFELFLAETARAVGAPAADGDMLKSVENRLQERQHFSNGQTH